MLERFEYSRGRFGGGPNDGQVTSKFVNHECGVLAKVRGVAGGRSSRQRQLMWLERWGMVGGVDYDVCLRHSEGRGHGVGAG